jgi:hypothetical protein
MPFQPAADLLGDLLGVQVSKAQAVRYTEAAGAAYVALQTEQADQIARQAPPALGGGEKLVMSADGAMVPLRRGEWAEVKTLAIGEVQPASQKQAAWMVRTGKLSYFSRLVDAERFEHLTLVEMHRRGVENSRQVAAVMDGADWLQTFVNYHRPDAVRILDFAHAAQRLSGMAQAVWGEGSPTASQWTKEHLHQLKHQGPECLLEEVRQLRCQHPHLEVLRENLGYLEKREAQMQYPLFQQQGWPIGSGMVESGNKLVVEARLKGAGMHWERAHVDPMLSLRNIVCSNRWQEEWPKVAERLRQQARQRRKQQREKRHQEKAAKLQLVATSTRLLSSWPDEFDLPQPAAQADPPSPVAKHPGPRKPAANHPWRHSPIGRARYQPTNPAKN